MRLGGKLRAFFADITLEPALAAYSLGFGLVAGSSVTKNFKLLKVCSIEFGHNDTVCKALSAAGNDAIQDEVQVYLNKFEIVETYMASWPAIVFSLFAGALSDRYGRKPLILLPIFGALINDCLAVFHLSFFSALPMEFFYLQHFNNWFGGIVVYYMGVYGHGNDITTSNNRATRMARFDGCEITASLVGTLISPYLFRGIGFMGTYIVSGLLSLAALLYIVFFVQETIDPPPTDSNPDPGTCFQKIAAFVNRNLINTFRETIATLIRKRTGHLRAYIMVLFAIYGLYWASFTVAVHNEYIFMLKTFKGFTVDNYSHLSAYVQMLNIVALFGLVPFTQHILHVDESGTASLITLSLALGYVVQAFSKQLFPDFYIGMTFHAPALAIYSLARAQLTKCVDQDEVGKIFSAVAFIAACVSLGVTPLGKHVYNLTIKSFPGTVFLLGAGAQLLASLLNLCLWFQRSEIQKAAHIPTATTIGGPSGPQVNPSFGPSDEFEMK